MFVTNGWMDYLWKNRAVFTIYGKFWLCNATEFRVNTESSHHVRRQTTVCIVSKDVLSLLFQSVLYYNYEVNFNNHFFLSENENFRVHRFLPRSMFLPRSILRATYCLS